MTYRATGVVMPVHLDFSELIVLESLLEYLVIQVLPMYLGRYSTYHGETED